LTLEEKLKKEFERWNYLKQFGGSDPNWADGCGMNLTRNHIIYCKREMEEQNKLTDTYYKETPPEVDNSYMARADEIRTNAKKSLEIYKSNSDYKYLLKAINQLNKVQIDETYISNVIGYVKGLEQFIKEDNLVSMRRHENSKIYIESFVRCRKKVEELITIKPMLDKQLQKQMSIMDFIGV